MASADSASAVAEKISSSVAEWQQRLLQLDRRNNLLYFRETVDTNGESNAGKPLPPTVTQPPVDAVQQAVNRYDDDPGPSEPNW